MLTSSSVFVISLIGVQIVVKGMNIVPVDGTWGMVANFIWLYVSHSIVSLVFR